VWRKQNEIAKMVVYVGGRKGANEGLLVGEKLELLPAPQQQ
jgi:hypothetical protein